MNLMFWKKKPPTEDSEVDSQKEPGNKTGSRTPLGDEPRRRETSEDKHGEKVDVDPAKSKRRLIIGAAIGIAVLVAIGMTTWIIFVPSPGKNTAIAVTPTSMQPDPRAERNSKLLDPIEFLRLKKTLFKGHQSDIEALGKKNDELPPMEVPNVEPSRVEPPPGTSRRAEIEILKKKNDELQTEIAALRKKQLQPNPSASPANQAADEAQAPARGGDIALSSENPKATAMTLKEAIEVMNASSGDPPRKAAR